MSSYTNVRPTIKKYFFNVDTDSDSDNSDIVFLFLMYVSIFFDTEISETNLECLICHILSG